VSGNHENNLRYKPLNRIKKKNADRGKSEAAARLSDFFIGFLHNLQKKVIFF
jgi:hypothetical protein